MTPLSLFLLIISLFYIALIVSIIGKKKKSKAFLRFVIFFVIGTLWVIIGILETSNLNSTDLRVDFFYKVDFIIALLISYFVFLFALHFPKENKRVKKIIELIIFLPALASAILVLSNKVFTVSFDKISYSFTWYVPYFFVVLFFFFGALFLLKRNLNKSIGLQHAQLKYIYWGLCITLVFGLSGSILSASFSKWRDVFHLLELLSTIIFASASSFAMMQYRLFDISLIFKRWVVRLLTFAIIFGVYLFAILSFKRAIDIQNENSQTVFLVIATLLVVATIEPIRKLVHNIVDSTFEKRDQKKEEIQKKVEFAFRSQQNVSNLIQSVSEFIETSFDVEKVVFLEKGNTFFNDKKEAYNFLQGIGRILIPEELPYRQEESERYFFISKELERVEESAYLSIGQGDLFMGIFALGKRKNNKAYTVEEVRELKRFQDDFTEALLNARLYQQAVERIKV